MTFKNNSESLLEKISFAYLALPVIIFLLNWVHLVYSIPLIGYIAWYVYKNWYNEISPEQEANGSSYGLFFGLLLVFVWIWFSGIGAFSFQNGDYQKHHAILNDLIQIDWPRFY